MAGVVEATPRKEGGMATGAGKPAASHVSYHGFQVRRLRKKEGNGKRGNGLGRGGDVGSTGKMEGDERCDVCRAKEVRENAANWRM